MSRKRVGMRLDGLIYEGVPCLIEEDDSFFSVYFLNDERRGGLLQYKSRGIQSII